jgi:hypothetical protein
LSQIDQERGTGETVAKNSGKNMSESERQEVRRPWGAPDNWVPGQQMQQQQQQQRQERQVTDEWEAQKEPRPRGEDKRDHTK